MCTVPSKRVRMRSTAAHTGGAGCGRSHHAARPRWCGEYCPGVEAECAVTSNAQSCNNRFRLKNGPGPVQPLGSGKVRSPGGGNEAGCSKRHRVGGTEWVETAAVRGRLVCGTLSNGTRKARVVGGAEEPTTYISRIHQRTVAKVGGEQCGGRGAS